jgi:hypothetical protein
MPSRMPRTSNDKQTHKLAPQTCVLWMPDAPGYAANFGPGGVKVSSHPEQAWHLTEDEAEAWALRMRSQLGMRAAIRPYYAQSPSLAGRA